MVSRHRPVISCVSSRVPVGIVAARETHRIGRHPCSGVECSCEARCRSTMRHNDFARSAFFKHVFVLQQFEVLSTSAVLSSRTSPRAFRWVLSDALHLLLARYGSVPRFFSALELRLLVFMVCSLCIVSLQVMTICDSAVNCSGDAISPFNAVEPIPSCTSGTSGVEITSIVIHRSQATPCT